MRNFSYKLRQIPYPYPRTFAGLMEMYEVNYMYIRNLLGDLRSSADVYRVEFDAAPPVWMSVIERTKYTVTLNLRYERMEAFSSEELPDVDVKVYLDALQAEVCALSKSSHSGQTQTNALLVSLEKRWKANRFLYKWLAYCTGQSIRVVRIEKSSNPRFTLA